MKSGNPHTRKLIPSALLAIGALALLVGLAFYWQPVVTFAQTTVQNLQEHLFLPLVIQNNEVPIPTPTVQPSEYVVISWNDLGMHCYNRDFKDLAVLPPFNTLWAQVIHRGDPPEIITSDHNRFLQLSG